jgi:ADP-L-glycero-D-manno-heptose 6-epimerase
MRSVVHKAFGQIMETGKVRLFKSYHPDYQDGEQMRDFIYIKDAVAMTLSFLEKPHLGGLFNVGTGKARTWQDLVSATFTALGKKINIEYIEMPESLRPKYQYFTQADMQRMKLASLENNQYPLEQGINDYVKQYLVKDYFLGDEKD